MWFRAWPLLLLPAVALADLKIVTRASVDGQEGVATSYQQGHKIRWDSGSFATIVNVDEHRTYQLNMDRRTWLVRQPASDPLLVLAMWIRRPPRVHESGKTVEVWYETTDTGERREMFGHAASHLITRERHVYESGGCTGMTGSTETVIDGWYIPRPASAQHKAFLSAYSSLECRDRVVTHGAWPVPGFALIETATNGRSISTREVIEYSEQPLDRSLFEPPGGFRQIEPSETWVTRAESDWQQVERAFESWLD